MSTKEFVLFAFPLLVIINFFAMRYLLLRSLQPIIDKLTKAEAESDLVSFMIHEKAKKTDLS